MADTPLWKRLAAAENKIVPGSASDVASHASGGDAVITYAGATGVIHVITGIAFDYATAPTSGSINVKDGSTKIFEQDITAAGLGVIYFPNPKCGTEGNDLVVTLVDGGVAKKVSVLNHYQV